MLHLNCLLEWFWIDPSAWKIRHSLQVLLSNTVPMIHSFHLDHLNLLVAILMHLLMLFSIETFLIWAWPTLEIYKGWFCIRVSARLNRCFGSYLKMFSIQTTYPGTYRNSKRLILAGAASQLWTALKKGKKSVSQQLSSLNLIFFNCYITLIRPLPVAAIKKIRLSQLHKHYYQRGFKLLTAW